MSRFSFITSLLWVAYPLLVFFGLTYLEPRIFGLVLFGLILLHQRRWVRLFASSLGWLQWAIIALGAVFSLSVVIANTEILLLFYPALINVFMLLLFGISIFKPPSMVERFARIREPELPPDGVQYMRRVTLIWCGFFVANGSIAAWTALSGDRAIWAIYNGLIAYLLMGILFAGEWLLRGYIRRNNPV